MSWLRRKVLALAVVEPRPSTRTRIFVAAEMLPQHSHSVVSLVREISLRGEWDPECILA